MTLVQPVMTIQQNVYLKKDIIVNKENQNAVVITLFVFLMHQRKGLHKSHFSVSG